MISYKKLFLMMEEREITKEKLKNEIGISSATMAKLSKNEEVAMSTIQSLCNFFNCQPGAILSYEKDIDENSILYRMKEEQEMKLKGGLYHQTQVRLAYNSNHIEGSRLTEDQTRSIYETQTIAITEGYEKIDDIIETVNHFRCFDYILSVADKELSEVIIKHIHFLLKNGTTDSQKEWFAVGEYKKRPNMIGDMIETTPPSKVSTEIKQLLKSYRECSNITFEDIIDFHYKFEKIHPFQDGNGRVGRLIMFKECLKYNIPPFIIEDRAQEYYKRGLREYSTEKGYLVETCRAAQDTYKTLLEYFEYI
ncbi:MAG: Fic family protein [Lachnospiraceae bacterium]|nr:Fic family protein [Lachnospiraceae bacterium]